MSELRRCEAQTPSDALEQELAARLNELINQRESERMQSLWPEVREVGYWVMGTTLIAIVLLISLL